MFLNTRINKWKELRSTGPLVLQLRPQATREHFKTFFYFKHFKTCLFENILISNYFSFREHFQLRTFSQEHEGAYSYIYIQNSKRVHLFFWIFSSSLDIQVFFFLYEEILLFLQNSYFCYLANKRVLKSHFIWAISPQLD